LGTALAMLVMGCGENQLRPSDPAGLTLAVNGGEVRYTRWAGGPTVMDYRFCYSISPSPGAVGPFTIQRAESTIIGPTSTPYNSSTDLFRPGTSVHGGLSGCPTVYSDPDVDRPLATTYRVRIDYTKEGARDTETVAVSGTFISRVPLLPLMSGLTVTHDFPEARIFLRRPMPVTFTATGQGGRPPYQFRWSINGFVLQDWNRSDTLVWDGATLAGRPIGNSDYRLLVQGRSEGNSDPEAAGSVDIRVQY
jgi:hypothetical protein